MKISISLISTILLSILLLASLYYSFFIKPKEITYTSYIPTTYKETKTSYITEKETLTKTETSSTTLIKTTTKIETSISITTYRIIEDEALITIGKTPFGHGGIEYLPSGEKIYISDLNLEIAIVNTGEHTILIDKDFVIFKGKGLSKTYDFMVLIPKSYHSIEKIILTPLNRTVVFRSHVILDAEKIKQEIKDSEKLQGELFITYKIIETNQFKTFNFTLNYMLSKSDVEY
jgi:hypothetical protein